MGKSRWYARRGQEEEDVYQTRRGDGRGERQDSTVDGLTRIPRKR